MPRVTGSPKQIIALELPASTAEAISLVQSFTNSATETEAIRLMIRSFRGFVDRADQPEFKALIESAAAATLDTRADIRLNLGLTEPQRASLGVIQRVLQRESAKQTIVALADFFCREIKAATTPGPILQKRLSSGELLLMLWS